MGAPPDERARFGFYLIPPYELCSQILTMRKIVQDQYRMSAALNFMIHMTIKGFFKPSAAFDRGSLVAELDRLLSSYQPFRIYPAALRVFEEDPALVLGFSRERNEILWRIRDECFRCVEPYVAADCDFTPSEQAGFIPHITVSMVDASLEALADAREYLSDLSFPDSGYAARHFKLYRFESQGWGTGDWIRTLQWSVLHSWTLRP